MTSQHLAEKFNPKVMTPSEDFELVFHPLGIFTLFAKSWRRLPSNMPVLRLKL